MGREDRDAGGPHVAHVGAHELEHEVEVVDHEVENDGDVRAARLERGEAVDLEEARLVQVRRRRPHGAVEPLHVPDLQHHPALRRAAHELLRGGHGIRERLFHQQRDPALEHREPHGRVGGGRHRDRHRVHPLEQRAERRQGRRVELLRHLGRARRILVVDAGERDARHAPQQPRVVEPERSGADDAHPHRRRAHTSTPRCDPSMNFRKCSTSATAGSSPRAFAIPWLTVMSELNSSR